MSVDCFYYLCLFILFILFSLVFFCFVIQCAMKKGRQNRNHSFLPVISVYIFSDQL